MSLENAREIARRIAIAAAKLNGADEEKEGYMALIAILLTLCLVIRVAYLAVPVLF